MALNKSRASAMLLYRVTKSVVNRISGNIPIHKSTWSRFMGPKCGILNALKSAGAFRHESDILFAKLHCRWSRRLG